MRNPVHPLFEPLESESLLNRLRHEFNDSFRELLADPVSYLKEAIARDDVERKRTRVILLGTAFCLFVVCSCLFVYMVVRFLDTPEIVGILDAKNRASFLDKLTTPPLPTPEHSQQAKGGGGGGGNEPNPPSFGQVPRFEVTWPITSPTTHSPTIVHPSVPVEPTLLGLDNPATKLDPKMMFGDPTSPSLIPSDGPGTDDGIGRGKNGGVGPHDGPGHGIGDKGGFGNGPYSLGGTRLARIRPQIQNSPRPEWTEEARRNRIQGMVELRAVLAANGEVRVVRVIRGLGYGLDEKAIEAAKKIKFAPARDARGNSIDYVVNISIDFRLL